MQSVAFDTLQPVMGIIRAGRGKPRFGAPRR